MCVCSHAVLGRVPLSTLTSDRIPRIYPDLGEFCKNAFKMQSGPSISLRLGPRGAPLSPQSRHQRSGDRRYSLTNLEILGDPSATHRPPVREDEQGRAPHARADVEAPGAGPRGLEPGRTA